MNRRPAGGEGFPGRYSGGFTKVTRRAHTPFADSFPSGNGCSSARSDVPEELDELSAATKPPTPRNTPMAEFDNGALLATRPCSGRGNAASSCSNSTSRCGLTYIKKCSCPPAVLTCQ